MKALKKGLKSECLLLTFVLIVNSVFSLKSKNILNPNFKNSELKVLKGCPLEDGSIIEFGVSRTLPGCKALRCIKEEISFALILQSCEVTKNDIPPGCKIIPRPELQYPKCCNILLHCEKVTTHVSPVVYTHKNISQLERKDSINKVGINEPQIKEIISSDVIKRNKKEEATRYRRELSSSAKPKAPIVKGVKKIKGCVTEFGFMDIDEEFVLPGCSKARCLETAEDEVALVIFSCPHDREKIPKGCKVVPPETENPFPECCIAKLVCVKKIIEVAPSIYTKSHLSLTAANPLNNQTLQENEEFNTSKAKIKRQFKKSSRLQKKIAKSSQKRLSRDLTSQITSNQTEGGSINKCLTKNGPLFSGEVIPLPGCQEKKCLETNGSYTLVHLGCDISTVEVPENCKISNSTSKQFPKCCELIFSCEETITELFEAVYTPYNISKINLNNSESLVKNYNKSEKELRDSFVNLKTAREENNNKTNSANTERRIDFRNNFNNSKEGDIDGCPTGSGIIRIGERVSMPNCSQLRCVTRKNSRTLLMVSCKKKEVKMPPGCEVIPPPSDTHYPECCQVTFKCIKELVKIIPIIHTPDNITLLTKNETLEFSSNNTDVDRENITSNPSIVEALSGGGVNLNKAGSNSTERSIFKKRSKRENILKIEPEMEMEENPRKCITLNGTLRVGDAITIPGCAEIRCVLSNNSTSLVLVSCPVKQDEEKKGCKIIENSSMFPKCCEVTWICEKVVESVYPVIYTAANISELPRNISENFIAPLDNNNNNVSNNNNILQTIRRRRETQKPTETKGCNVTNGILRPGHFIPLKNCARLECLANKDDFYLAVASCPPSKVTLPTGCKIIPKNDVQYPECCEVVMECIKVKKELIPVTYTAANISSIDIDAKENLVKPSTSPVEGLKLGMDTSETQRSRRVLKARFASENDSKTSNSSLAEETSKATSQNSAKNERVKRIQRKPNSRPRTTTFKNETKPSFVLTPQKRTSRSRRIENGDKKANETIELKHNMFITVSPTGLQSSSSDNDTTHRPSKRRRLSSLLSSRSLRANTTPKSQTDIKSGEITAESQDKPRINRSKTEIKPKISKDESKKTKKVIETTNRNETLPEKVVKRRNIYANRLNKYIAKIGPNEMAKISAAKNQTQEENPQKKTSLKKKTEKQEKKSKKIKKKKKTSKTKKVNKKKSNKKSKTKTDSNSSLRRRLRTRPKTSAKLIKPENKEEIPKRDSKPEDKKEEESKNLPVRSRSNFNKKEKSENKEEEKKKKKASVKDEKKIKNTKREKKLKETNTRAPRRRKQTPKTVANVKKVESKPKTKEISRKRKTKPSFELKLETEKTDETKEKELGRGKAIFDVSKLNTNISKTESTNQASKTTHPISRNRGSRRRVKKPKDKVVVKEKDKETETKKEKTIILEPTTETSIKKEKKDDTKPESISKTDVKIVENEITIPPEFASIYNPDYSFLPTSLDDFDKFYKYPMNDLEISSSDKEDSKSPNTKENEIIDIPDPPKVPMKITTVSFSTSRRSYKTSKTRNTSKNFKETPTVYDKKETFKSSVFKR